MRPIFFWKLVQRIREEFEDAPGLRLTLTEGARFWGLDLATCERVLAEPLAGGFLARGADEQYRQVTLPNA
jgi:Fic family protein